ncbi:hypothetical protein [Paenibacillus radicis (ex Xue et al. 2023)]|uniref:Uncharacterized protein n=1 Tax=Paenibacillus radicis (ex Xue et al. 2023) TaxID=2972489 RepID=A0ABT1YP73_9BACL|nr:hypothetical protein [Paenibacillus radicis (ex Xue et al. 2023)]MCR8634520.1 hypothetical protein [Paenibacillus radicis (ex Xue et al. 2023)]
MRLLPLPMDGVKILKKRTLSVAARSASEAIFAFEAFFWPQIMLGRKLCSSNSVMIAMPVFLAGAKKLLGGSNGSL